MIQYRCATLEIFRIQHFIIPVYQYIMHYENIARVMIDEY